MPKYTEMAKAMDEADKASLLQVMRALKTLDTLNDKRFQAFDEVINGQTDIIEDLSKKIDAIEKPKPVDFQPIQKAITELRGMIKPPAAPTDVKHIEKLLGDVTLRVAFMEKKADKIEDMLEKLLTAKRVPEFDLSGNVVAVRLEA